MTALDFEDRENIKDPHRTTVADEPANQGEDPLRRRLPVATILEGRKWLLASKGRPAVLAVVRINLRYRDLQPRGIYGINV
jgi:hypothetical protein